MILVLGMLDDVADLARVDLMGMDGLTMMETSKRIA